MMCINRLCDNKGSEADDLGVAPIVDEAGVAHLAEVAGTAPVEDGPGIINTALLQDEAVHTVVETRVELITDELDTTAVADEGTGKYPNFLNILFTMLREIPQLCINSFFYANSIG